MRKPTTESSSWIVITEITIVPEMAEMKNTKYGFSDIKVHVAGNTALGDFQVHHLR